MRLPNIFRRKKKAPVHAEEESVKHLYTFEEVQKITANVYEVAYNDGKREGIAVARQLATKSLK